MIYFDALPSRSELEGLVHRDLLSFDSWSGRSVNGRWTRVPFNVDQHLIEHEVSDESALAPFAEQMMMKPLQGYEDPTVPLWELHCVRNRGKGRSMLFARVDHSCGDGIALHAVLSRIGTAASGAPLPKVEYTRPPRARLPFLSLICDVLRAAFKYLTVTTGAYDGDLPISVPWRLKKAGLVHTCQRQLSIVPDHSLNMIKRIKNAAGPGFTVNDVVYAATAGALRRYCLARHVDPAFSSPASSLVRALVPVAFPRPPDAPLVNNWCFVGASVPVHAKTPAARLRSSHAIFEQIKGPEVAIAKFVTDQTCMQPDFLFGFLTQAVFSRHSLVFSNVPGPSEAVYICGKKVVGIQALYPNLITQCLAVSYGGVMQMNFVTDPDVIDSPAALVEMYLDELHLLAAAYGVDPNNNDPPPPKSATSSAGGATSSTSTVLL